MDATCAIQNSIHVFSLVHINMCPGFWVHITTGNWRNKNDYDSSALVGMIMPIGSHTSPEEGQGFF